MKYKFLNKTQRLVSILALFQLNHTLLAQDSPLPHLSIEAKSYPITSVRASRSKTIYLFKVQEHSNLPMPGAVLLLREGQNLQPKMGLRVLKQFVDSDEFAAKKIKEYEDGSILKVPSEYKASEKTREITEQEKTEVAPSNSKDEDELEELTDTKPSDGDENSIPLEETTSSPGPSKPFVSTITSTEKSILASLEMNEVQPFDQMDFSLSLEGGGFRNYGPSGKSVYYMGAGGRLAWYVLKNAFANSAQNQDSLALEASLFYYTVSGLIRDGDSYSVLPIEGTLRYNLALNETFWIYVYGGVLRNYVFAADLATNSGLSLIQNYLPAAGGGIILVVGPGWELRANLGFDVFAAGLMLRF